MSRDSLVEKYNERHEGVDYFYTTCHNNGCWDATCLIKCGIKDGKVVSIEPDDSVNAGIAREDDDENAVQTGMLQARACPMGHAWRQELYSENRLLYPMKRVGEKGSGRGHFERISWDEALDTIAEKMRVMAKENPDHPWLYYCYYVAFESSDFPFASYMPGTITGWGDHSTSGSAAAEDWENLHFPHGAEYHYPRKYQRDDKVSYLHGAPSCGKCARAASQCRPQRRR